MKKIYCLILGLFALASLPVWADISLDRLLNKISFQLSAEQWVTTKTALVNVRINAAVSDQAIENLQSEIIKKLNQISNKGEWHILSFDRQQDKSGLETIQIMAQSRLAQTELANLRNNAKAITKAGETYTIDNVQFIPSEDEIKEANILLRNNLYQQAKAEINLLNNTYPEQKFYLHQIDFFPTSPITPQVLPAQEMMMTRAVAPAMLARPLSVGNKVALQANVVVAAMPDVIQKLAHN